MDSSGQGTSQQEQAAANLQTARNPRASRTRIVLRWVAVACVAALIFFMSSRTSTQLGGGFFGNLKEQLNLWINGVAGTSGDPMSSVAHFCEYALLGACVANALRSHMTLGRACLWAIACASAYGVTDEFHQLFVDGRMCDPVDWVVDTAGAALGAACVRLLLRTAR